MPREQPISRLMWQVRRLASFKRPSGFTMSSSCLSAVWDREEAFPSGSVILSTFALMSRRFLDRVERGELEINFYIDAAFQEYVSTYGEHKQIDPQMAQKAFLLEERGFRLAKNVFTFCDASAHFIQKQYGIPAKAVLPGPNISYPIVEHVIRTKRRTTFDPFVITFVGMDWQRKGLPRIARAVADLRSKGHDVVLRIIGDAPPDIVSQPGVEFIGRIDKAKDMLRYATLVHNSDLGILMSEAEAFGLSPLESLALGVPVVSTDVGGMPDYVTSEVGILLDPATSFVELANRLETLVLRSPEWQALARAAEKYGRDISWAKTMGQIGRELGYVTYDIDYVASSVAAA